MARHREHQPQCGRKGLFEGKNGVGGASREEGPSATLAKYRPGEKGRGPHRANPKAGEADGSARPSERSEGVSQEAVRVREKGADEAAPRFAIPPEARRRRVHRCLEKDGWFIDQGWATEASGRTHSRP